MKNNYTSQSVKFLLGAIAISAASLPSAASATTFNFTGAIDSYTVPTSGVYNIEALGAQSLDNGGLGGKLAANFNLNAGEILKILVGGVGGSGNGNGGGGGTFVVLNGTNPLVIAGGGGGTFSFGEGGGGGGGFFSDGDSSRGRGGFSFANGGGGGGGGFGGGGGGGFGGGGGGGGGNGGGGGGNFGGGNGGGGSGGFGSSSLSPGGSGGSPLGGSGGGIGGYNSTRLATIANLISSDAVRTGNGIATISFVSAPTSVPEPFTIIGTIVGGTAALRLRKKLKAIAD